MAQISFAAKPHLKQPSCTLAEDADAPIQLAVLRIYEQVIDRDHFTPSWERSRHQRSQVLTHVNDGEQRVRECANPQEQTLHRAKKILARSPSDIGIPSIVLCEFEVGIAKSTSPRKRLGQLEELTAVVRTLPFGVAEARASAAIRSSLEKEGTPIGPL